MSRNDNVLERGFEPTKVDFAISEPEEEYFEGKIGSYTTYSGADMLISIDGETLASCAAIEWREDVTSGHIDGELVFTLFNDAGKQLRDRLFAQRYEAIEVRMKNEYGAQAGYRLLNPQFLTRSTGASMDDVVLEDLYRFSAERFEWLEVE